MMNKEYQRCSQCIMDTSDFDIKFDADGVCNHCHNYEIQKKIRLADTDKRDFELKKLVNTIKKKGKSKDYDCIIGVSGGVDSTYVAYLTKQLGLRPLAIHFDNGWNSELAVKNIENTLNKLNVDLYTYVIDWEEFRDLQISFLRANTPDGEIPTDHAINALLFREANKRGMKYIINGMNFRTEPAFRLPKWAYGHADWKYIRNIHKIHGTVKLKKYPHFSLFDTFYFLFVKRIKLISLLNYVEFDKEKVMSLIQDELEWKYYGGKHYESVYTRFYQAYILPKKFKIDKRIVHLSGLILSGLTTRDSALEEMKKEIADKSMLKRDKEFVMKKLLYSDKEFELMMNEPTKTFMDYPNNYDLVLKLKKIHNWFREKGYMSK